MLLEVRDPNGNVTEFDITYTRRGSMISLWNITILKENLAEESRNLNAGLHPKEDLCVANR